MNVGSLLYSVDVVPFPICQIGMVFILYRPKPDTGCALIPTSIVILLLLYVNDSFHLF